MKIKDKSKLKKNVTTGAATVAGAVGGVAAGMYFAEDANAEPIIEPTVSEDVAAGTITPKTGATVSHQQHNHVDSELPHEMADDPNPTLVVEPVFVEPEPIAESDPVSLEDPIEGSPYSGDEFLGSGEVEVLDYQRVLGEDGHTQDVAVVNIEGSEVNVIDYNLDGFADIIVGDFNQDGVIENSEIQNVEGMGLDMQPLQESIGFDHTLAHDPNLGSDSVNFINDDPFLTDGNDMMADNDLPDYVNDADIDSFMA